MAAAPVVAVGVDGRGAMAVPEDVRAVGWYHFGPRPGATSGSAVLSGHVDDRVQGRGAFAALGEVRPGDPVDVELANGTRLGYQMRTIERVPKATLPADRLFARSGPPRLTLVTCGGELRLGHAKLRGKRCRDRRTRLVTRRVPPNRMRHAW